MLVKIYEYVDKVVGLSIESQAVPPMLRMVIRITWLKIELSFDASGNRD